MSVSFIYPHFLWFTLLVPLTILLAVIGQRRISSRRYWCALVLRCLLLMVIVFALAGIQLYLPSDTFTAVFVLDYSDSISPQEKARGEEIIYQTIAEMPSGDQAAIVVFGKDALVERLADEVTHSEKLASVPVSTRTDIYSALQLALALFPDEGSKRLVLLSDGRENIRQAVKQAEMAAMQNVEIVYVALGDQHQEGEVLVENIDTPAEVRYGQDFNLDIDVQSNLNTSADLQIYGDGNMFYSREIILQPGLNRFSVLVEKEQTGFHRYRAVIIPDQDKKIQNNEASAFTMIQGAPNILVVEGEARGAQNLVQSLEAAEMKIKTISPEEMPTLLEDMAQYEVIILVNVPLSAIPGETLKTIPVFVRDMGHGFWVVGGDQAYGAGGYLRSELEEVLPVNMEVSSKDRTKNLALVLAVDKSGSMGRCHCDSSDLNQSYTRQEVGQPKVDIAKEAIMRSANALGSQDYLGVVSFDDQAHWALEIRSLPEQTALENSIGGITANGQTNLQAGMQAAFEALKDIDARRKHVIMLTDGWTYSGDISGMVHKMKDAGITVSMVAAGGGSADYLRSLADAGGGRYYAAEDMLSVPDIFLKETVQSVGDYIIEEPFYPLQGNPSQILRGIDESLLPALLGYNGTSIKRTARLDLLTGRGDPLLATWQFGLGKAAAWTSDMQGKWAGEWVVWDYFPRFNAQLVGWLLPASRTEGFSAKAEVQDEGVLLSLEAEDEQGHSLNNLTVRAYVINPDLKTQEISLKQVSAGRYEALSDLDQPGTYLITINAGDNLITVGQAKTGLVVPYSPEYRKGGVNLLLLDKLAQITGGAALTDTAQVFTHNLASQPKARELWHTLLMIVAILFPLDVALRRLSLTKRDWLELFERFRLLLRGSPNVSEGRKPRLLGELFNARFRTRQHRHRVDNVEQLTLGFDDTEEKEDRNIKYVQTNLSSEDTLKRLQEAKQRAKKKN